MGNCFKKPSGKERLIQLDKNYSESGSGSLYDASIYDVSYCTDPPMKPKGPMKGPMKPTPHRDHRDHYSA